MSGVLLSTLRAQFRECISEDLGSRGAAARLKVSAAIGV
jgi:hypothetical protein